MSLSETNWEALWKDENVRAHWQEPEENLRALVSVLQKSQGQRVLDVGFGIGRHIILFARCGFDTYGIEATASGLSYCREWLKQLNLTAHLVQGDMSDTGQFEEGFFDAVVCWHVVYHAQRAKIGLTLKGIHRVLRPGGFLYITFNSTKNKHYGQGIEVEPNTFIATQEKLDGDLVHHYNTYDEALHLLDGFNVTQIQEKEDTVAGQIVPQTYHWHAIAQKRMENNHVF